MKACPLLITVCCVMLSAPSPAQNSVFPAGGQVGTSFEVKIPGVGASQWVWFDTDLLTGEVKVESDDDGAYGLLNLTADPSLKPGFYRFRLIQPNSILRPLPLLIHAEPPVMEADEPHHTPSQAQLVGYPSVVNGRISEAGELDYYAVEVPAGEELLFELISSSGLISPPQGARLLNEPEIALYEPTGSWFDPYEPRRIEPDRDASALYYWPPRLPSMAVPTFLPRLTHRFDTEGWYLIEVGERQGLGSKDHGYMLRIARVEDATTSGSIQWTPHEFVHPQPHDWQERAFADRIEPDWLRKLWSRTAERPKKDESAEGQPPATDGPGAYLATFETDLGSVAETEPNDEPSQAAPVGIPMIIEGAIDRPDDRDHFKINVKADQPLAFEIRALDMQPPHFSPRLGVFNAAGEELFSNIYTKVAGDGDDWIKSIEAKTIHTFDEAGEYTVQLRDLTSRRGGPRCAYQLLVRPQIPHVGETVFTVFGGRDARFKDDRVNMHNGGRNKMVIVAELEEGFNEEIILEVENLPPGVRVLPLVAETKDVSFTGQVYEFRGTSHKERYRPPRRAEAVMFMADQDAPNTFTLPHMSRLVARPLLNNAPGAPIICQEIPVKVVIP